MFTFVTINEQTADLEKNKQTAISQELSMVNKIKTVGTIKIFEVPNLAHLLLQPQLNLENFLKNFTTFKLQLPSGCNVLLSTDMLHPVGVLLYLYITELILGRYNHFHKVYTI